MTDKLINGDYKTLENSDILESVDYLDELVQSVKTVLTMHRGKFYPNKNFGSKIKDGLPENANSYALAFAMQAVDTIDGVYIKNAEINESEILFTVIVNDKERQVKVEYESNV